MPIANLAGRAYAPADYDEVFRSYFPLMLRVATRWVDADTAEDMAMTLMLRFMERGGLARFDPERLTMRTGLPLPVPFAVFVAAFVNQHAWTLHRAWLRERKREILMAEVSGDLLDESPSPESIVDAWAVSRERLDQLCEIVTGARPGKRGLVLVRTLRHLNAQVEVLGRIDIPRLAQRFAVSVPTAFRQLAEIRLVLGSTAPAAPD